jgi:hypothetical protein
MELHGETGSDTYEVAAGSGWDTIVNADSSTSSFDILRFLDVSDGNAIWLGQNATGDLVVSNLGLNEGAILSAWNSSPTTQIDEIRVRTQAVDRAGIDQLISAMAAFTDPTTGLAQAGISATTLPSEIQLAIAGAWTTT